DAVMDVKVTPVTPRGWFASSRGLRVEGVAIAVTPPTAGSADALDLNEAADVATRAPISQLQALPSFLGTTDRYGVVIAPMLAAPSGQQTAATRLLEQQVADRLGAYPRLQLLPFQISRLREAQYLLTGTMRRVAPSQDVFQISLALTDTKTGTVVARATARARGDGLDTTPTAYYRDSPIVVKDTVVDGYIGTAETAPPRRRPGVRRIRSTSSASPRRP